MAKVKVMTQKQAETRAKKLLGPKAFVRYNPKALTEAEKVPLREEMRRLGMERDQLKKADRKDPRYVEVVGLINRIQGQLLYYRCEAGHIGGFTGFPMAIIASQADTWEEAIGKVEKRGY